MKTTYKIKHDMFSCISILAIIITQSIFSLMPDHVAYGAVIGLLLAGARIEKKEDQKSVENYE